MVLITVSVHLGGLSWIPTRWNPAWDVQPLFSINPEVRVTLVGSVFHGVVWWMCTAGSDQTAIQLAGPLPPNCRMGKAQWCRLQPQGGNRNTPEGGALGSSDHRLCTFKTTEEAN